MRNFLELICISIIISGLAFIALAQPCLTGWQYRKTIEMNNTGVSLTSHQVSVVVNTQVLVALGKVRVDGGDIRFTDASGNSISFWYDASEFNTSTTTSLIKTNDSAGLSDIYLFYGNVTSLIVDRGDGTFGLLV